ncbi:Phenylacetaldehyde reductase-like protein [Drosera capensis]
MIGEGKVVCVTGANGYIASWIIKLLLLRGYTVNATVRDLNDTKKTEHLLALEGAMEQLHLFEANLLEDGSFDPAIEGCEGVLHVATPCIQQAEDPQAEIIDPAVKGTLNVLSSCVKVPTVQRVVVTSSMAAVICNPKSQIPGVIIDETWFSDIEMMKHIKAWYPLAKTLAEDAAWKFAKEKGIDLVVVHPYATIGPSFQPTLNEGSAMILALIGAKTYPNALYGWIHVKDVAAAHIRAFEDSSAHGRYCLAERVVSFSEIVKILRELFPELQLPDKCADEERFLASYEVSKEKAKGLGLEFVPLEVSLKETIESLQEKNFIHF